MKRKSFIGIILSIVMCFCLSGCSFFGNTIEIGQSSEAIIDEEPTTDPDDASSMTYEEAVVHAMEKLENMTLEEKVGQLFVVNLEQIDRKNGTFFEWKKCTKRMIKNLGKYKPGGVILFSRNIANRKQTTNLISNLQANSQLPLLITVDEEGGDVSRIASNDKMQTTKFPTMETIGREKDSEYVYDMGSTIGSEIKELGFNVDFAPVADVKTSVLNKEIGSRSFGCDADKVAELTSAFVKGMQSQNISATLKHFPGQGSSLGDTHIESVNIDSSITALRKTDFVPFEAGIEAGADFVMVSHISVSKVTETSQPASMSRLIMQTILREELGFKGVIVTDAMDMAPIVQNYTAGEAALKAIEGGADIVLMPADFFSTYKYLLEKVDEGKLTEERINESVLRILTVKYQRGIIEP